MDSVGGTSGVGQSLTASAVRRLRGFRNRTFGCLERRGDALFELIDALLAAESVPSLPHLSLQPTHRRGWGSVYAALAAGAIDTERVRTLEQADRWTWLILAAYTQLRLARPITADARLPWER